MDYGFFKAFEQMKSDVSVIKAAVTGSPSTAAELAILRQKVTDLVAQHVVDDAAKAALQADLDTLFAQTVTVKGELAALATPQR